MITHVREFQLLYICIHRAVGCIMGELLNGSPLFPGENDIEQLCCVLRILGTPSPRVWPVSSSHPGKAWDCSLPQ